MNKFNLDEYRRLLGVLKDAGRPFLPFKEDAQNGLLFRLDVDFDIESAARLAAVNSELGVSATFFVQVSSPFYNALIPENRRELEKIALAGQRVGFHYHHCGRVLDMDVLVREFEILRLIVPDAQRVLAWHNPEGDLAALNAAAQEAGFVCAYADAFFGSDRYISDSNCNRDAQEMIRFVAESKQPLIQVLLHPEIWHYGGDKATDILEVSFRKKIGELSETYSQNRIWRKGFGEEIMKRIFR